MFQTVLQIGPQSTIVISTLVSNQTVQGKLLLQAGIQKSVVAISHVPHQAVLSMSTWTPTILQRNIANTIVVATWEDAMLSSRQDLHFVLSTSVTCRTAGEGETLVGLLTPDIATGVRAYLS